MQLLQDVVSLHTVWSICVPFALVEAYDRERPPAPWLGRAGLVITAVIFVCGSAFLTYAQIESEDFVAKTAQFAGAAAVIVGLVVLAFVVGRRPRPQLNAVAPSPWVVGAAAFVASSIYWAHESLPESASIWLVVAAWFMLVGLVLVVILRWSRSRGRGESHRLALAGGALLTYVWMGFKQGIYLDVPRSTALLGNVVFAVGAIALLVGAARVVASARERSMSVGGS